MTRTSVQTKLNLMGNALGLSKGLTIDDYLQEFIDRAKIVHCNKYIYSKSTFSFLNKKVSIECPVHGNFEQKPLEHLRGRGCKLCGDIERGKKKTRKFAEVFLNKCHEVHGKSYDYSDVNYINSQTKVTIICPKHGPFTQRPSNHLRGIGCPDCGTKTTADKQRKSLLKFLTESYVVHGEKYDYSKVVYKTTHSPVIIICHIHGEFLQSPVGHIQGRGCVYCAAKVNGDKMRSNTQDFISRAQKIHGDKFDYSQVNYTSNNVNVKIICKEHGIFEQKPTKHLDGRQGCPSCAGKNIAIGNPLVMLRSQQNVKVLVDRIGCERIGGWQSSFYNAANKIY